MISRGLFQPQTFCDSVLMSGDAAHFLILFYQNLKPVEHSGVLWYILGFQPQYKTDLKETNIKKISLNSSKTIEQRTSALLRF